MQKDQGSAYREEEQKIQSNEGLIYSIVNWSSVIASCFFVLGSVLYWPGVLSKDSKLGESSFLIGSFFYLTFDLGIIREEPQSNPVNCFKNVSALVNLWCIISDIGFILSSVLFLQQKNSEVGWNIFILASGCIIMASSVLAFALYNQNIYTYEFNQKYRSHKKDILLSGIFNTFGSLFLIAGSPIFTYQEDIEANQLIQNWIFLFGTTFYLIGTLITLKTSKKIVHTEEKSQKQAINDGTVQTNLLVPARDSGSP